MASRRSAAHPFTGKTAMDALMRRFDWSRTPIGTPDTWPGTWHAAVRLSLDSPFPMVTLLGKEFIFLYNDATIDIVGGKHPAILGQRTASAWAEIWENPVGPIVRHVMATGQPTATETLMLPLQRHGYPEETHFVLGFSAICDERGKPNAQLVLVREATERVLGERQAACLDALSTRCYPAETAEQACAIAAQVMKDYPRDLPMTLIYLMDRDGRTARLAAHSGLREVAESLGPVTIPANAETARDPWNVSRAAHTSTIGTVEGVSTLLEPYVNEGTNPPQIAVTTPLAAPSGGTAAVLVAGTNPMRPLAENRKFVALVAERLATAIATARAKELARERTEALAALDRAKTLFLSDVSHEFRTPLTLLLSPLDEVIARGSVNEGERELLQTSRRAGTRLLKLVQSLLDFSRVEAGRIQASFEPVELSAVTADIVSLFRSTFERAKLALTVDCPPLGEVVYVDRDMWEKIVLNLVCNALKFTLAGEVRVSLRLEEEWVVLQVVDTGSGVEPADVPHVFERFHRGRTAEARSAEGSGIGLSLVQELVKLHGGTVGLESELGRGTTFTVRLRRGSQHLAPDRLIAPPRPAAATGAHAFLEEASGWIGDDEPGEAPRIAAVPNVTTERILVVDDNADMRRYLRRILKEHWTVDTCSDGLRALTRVRKSLPELIIADLMMPGLDGLSLLAALREDPKTSSVPVMVLSARSNQEASIEALNAGADDYLPKPFSAQELVARVAVQLARARLRQAERIARETAEQSNVLKDELVAVLSQSLRNPLNAMLNTIGMLKDQSFGEDTWRALELIRASTREQHRLIDEVHDVSCIAAGCFHVDLKRIQTVSPIVSEEVDAVRTVASAKRVRLESFIDALAGPVNGDPERLRQVVHNLVSHALACTPAGGNVIVECRARGEYVELAVRDNGIGIAPETLPHLFDPVWQLHQANAEPARVAGLGLGLAVSHRIVELHGGRIFVVSEGDSRGAVFIVRLPVAVAAGALPATRGAKLRSRRVAARD
jgi:signal transduction histidine kinase